MWSPKRNANGARNQFYENMRDVSPGDVVFSFCDTRIKAIGVVTGGVQTGPKPDFGAAGSNWSQEGWFVPVDYCVLDNQIRPKDHAAILRPFLPEKYSPLQGSGDGLQSVYLASVPESMANALIGLIGQAFWDGYSAISAVQSVERRHERGCLVLGQRRCRIHVPRADSPSAPRPGSVQSERPVAGECLSCDGSRRASASEGQSHQTLAKCYRLRTARRCQRPITLAAHRSSL